MLPISLKSDLRRVARDIRKKAHANNALASFQLRDRFLNDIKIEKGALIAGYVAFGSELDPYPLLSALFDQGHPLCLPVTQGENAPLSFYAFAPGDRLSKGEFGYIREPRRQARALEPDLLIVPLLAFDKEKNRLGQGGGYYDRTLRGLRKRKKIIAIGIAFAAQEVEKVPFGPLDESVDKIVTETQSL